MACGGTGLDPGTRMVEVAIPPGVETGARLKVRGAGEAGRGGGAPGDCIILLTVREHGSLKRHGRDVETTRPVTFFQALLGGWVQVPSLEGLAKVHVPPGSGHGVRLKMSGLGVAGESGERGDQIVTLEVESPAEMSEEDKAALERLGEQLSLRPFPRTRAYEASLVSGDPPAEERS